MLKKTFKKCEQHKDGSLWHTKGFFIALFIRFRQAPNQVKFGLIYL